MFDWSGDLNSALATGDPVVMKSMLSRVPKEVLHRAAPYIEAMAQRSAGDGKLQEALTFYTQLVELEPEKPEWYARRAGIHFKLDQVSKAMHDANRIIELRPDQLLGHLLKAQAHDELRERPQALAEYRRVLRLDPSDERSKQRIAFLESELHKERILKQTIGGAALPDAHSIEMPAAPEIQFNPALHEDASVESLFPQPMIDGLKQILKRYSNQQSPKNALARLEDFEWISAWDAALVAARNSIVLMMGSELGVLTLRARHHGAKKIVAIESLPLAARIAGGIVQKNLLLRWRAQHGAAIESWSEDERRSSFETFSQDFAVVSTANDLPSEPKFDCFVFPNIDHSLLGTGIVKAVRRIAALLAPGAKFLPARAKLFAMPIQWRYASSPYSLAPIDGFRWSLYPQPLDLSREHWTPLAEPVSIGAVDFERFAASHSEFRCSISTDGEVNAIVYWFELDLGSARLTNAPDGPLRCMRPAVQYCDPVTVARGDALGLRVTITETRLHIDTQTGTQALRSHQLPSWYIPMLLDGRRNELYLRTIKSAFEACPPRVVLDIGAGCGLLSMMAAASGAANVVACELSPALSAVARNVTELNGFASQVRVVQKDFLKFNVPADLAERADFAVFELFDCSLIGEGVLHFISYARQHLLKDGARTVPIAGRIRAALVEYRVDRVLDVDVNLLNPYRFSPSFINVDATSMNYRPLTEPFDVFAFHFADASPSPDEKEIVVPAIGDGTVGAVLFWFDLQLDETTWLSNAPDRKDSLHWRQGLQFLPEVRIVAGSSIPLVAKHDGSSLIFQLKAGGLPKDAYSALPRFDPRCWQETKELEQQTEQLLQHCMHNPDEYKRVADLAMRIAIDPAQHEIDPTIAQRFAAIFLRN